MPSRRPPSPPATCRRHASIPMGGEDPGGPDARRARAGIRLAAAVPLDCGGPMAGDAPFVGGCGGPMGWGAATGCCDPAADGRRRSQWAREPTGHQPKGPLGRTRGTRCHTPAPPSPLGAPPQDAWPVSAARCRRAVRVPRKTCLWCAACARAFGVSVWSAPLEAEPALKRRCRRGGPPESTGPNAPAAGARFWGGLLRGTSIQMPKRGGRAPRSP